MPDIMYFAQKPLKTIFVQASYISCIAANVEPCTGKLFMCEAPTMHLVLNVPK